MSARPARAEAGTRSAASGPGPGGTRVGAAARPARRASGTEAALQAAWARFLDAALPEDAVHHHSPGEGRRGWKAQAALKASGFTTGWPDSEVVWGGRVFFLELKSKGRKPTAAQRECHERLRRAGAEIAVGTTLDELYGRLVQWGIPLRVTMEEWRRPRGAARMTAAEFRALGMAPDLRQARQARRTRR